VTAGLLRRDTPVDGDVRSGLQPALDELDAALTDAAARSSSGLHDPWSPLRDIPAGSIGFERYAADIGDAPGPADLETAVDLLGDSAAGLGRKRRHQ
jgi:hypothetical protein